MNRIHAFRKEGPESSLPLLLREDAARRLLRTRTQALPRHQPCGTVILGFPASVGGTGLPQRRREEGEGDHSNTNVTPTVHQRRRAERQKLL